MNPVAVACPLCQLIMQVGLVSGRDPILCASCGHIFSILTRSEYHNSLKDLELASRDLWDKI